MRGEELLDRLGRRNFGSTCRNRLQKLQEVFTCVNRESVCGVRDDIGVHVFAETEPDSHTARVGVRCAIGRSRKPGEVRKPNEDGRARSPDVDRFGKAFCSGCRSEKAGQHEAFGVSWPKTTRTAFRTAPEAGLRERRFVRLVAEAKFNRLIRIRGAPATVRCGFVSRISPHFIKNDGSASELRSTMGVETDTARDSNVRSVSPSERTCVRAWQQK